MFAAYFRISRRTCERANEPSVNNEFDFDFLRITKLPRNPTTPTLLETADSLRECFVIHDKSTFKVIVYTWLIEPFQIFFEI